MADMPERQDSDSESLQQYDQANTYDYYAKALNGNKRDYVFSYADARSCPHRHLVATAIGGNTYRCTDCNYFYTIVTAHVEPMHLATVKAAYQLVHFAKEFGFTNLQHVLRQPHGQDDGTPHKGVIPDGMDFQEALAAFEGVNVNTPDRGDAEMKAIVETIWPSDREMKRRIKALRGSDNPAKQAQAARLEAIMEERLALRESERHEALGDGEEPRMPVVSEDRTD